MKSKKVVPILALAALLASACTVELPGGKNAPSSGRSSDTSLKSIFINDDKYDEIREEYEVESTVKTVRVSATPADEGAQLAVVPSGAISISEGVTKKFTITVAAEDGTEKFYPILVRRAQDTSDGTALSYITVNGERIYVNGTEISYEVPSSTEEVSVAAVPKLSTSTVTFITGDSGQIDRGGMAVFRIKVTASDETEKTYTLTVKRPASLSSNTSLSSVVLLDVEGSIVAQVGTISTSMSCDVPAETEQVSVSARAESGGATVSVSPSSLTPVGTSGAVFTITVEAENGAVGTYTLTVRQAAPIDSDTSLSDILVNGVSIGASSTEWSVAASVEKVSVIANPKSEGASASVSPAGEQSVAPGASITFTITVTAADKTTEAYRLTVKRPSDASEADLSLASLTVNGEAVFVSDSMTKALVVSEGIPSASVSVAASASSASATASVSPSGTRTVSVGSSETFTITVSADGKSKTYTLTVSVSTAVPPPALTSYSTDYYWTNRDGAVGTNKTISSFSDWTDKERIAQCAAYDDPRTWRGIQEVPYDAYALYAAWDNSNLYLMVELTNIVGQMAGGNGFMWHDYASSDNACWWNRDIAIGFSFNTGKGTTAHSPAMDGGGVVWGSIDFTDEYGFDVMAYHSSKWGCDDNKGGAFQSVGIPYFGKAMPDGKFSYFFPYSDSYANLGIDIHFKDGCAVSSQVYYEATPAGNRAESSQTGQTLLSSSNYKSVASDGRSTSYWYKIPFNVLGIDKAYLESTGIGVRQLTTNSGSLMDCIPWDVSMVDVAGEACPDDESTSAEKSDKDVITTAMARIGHL